MRKITVIAFDLDDTLYDHRQYVTAGFKAAAKEVMRRKGIDIYDDLVTTYFHDEVYHQTFDVVLNNHGLSTDLVPILITKYHEQIGNLTSRPNVKSILSYLSNKYRIALITEGKNPYKKLLQLDLEDAFDFILATDDHDFSKSDSEPFQRLLERFEIEPAEAVYVGDDPRVDFYHPNILGMHTVWVRCGLHADLTPIDQNTPDIETADIGQLPEIITNIES